MPASFLSKTAASVPWLITNTWQFLDWHATPDIAPLVEAIRSLPGWIPGNPAAIDIPNNTSTGHRRVWAFDRDPRTSVHDYPEIGPTPFVPFLTAPAS